MGSTPRIYTSSYYDMQAHVTKQVANNLFGGYEMTTSSYAFADKPYTFTYVYTGSEKTTRTEVYAYTYDERERIK